MNIQEAKETIEKALRAYFARDEIGFPLVPLRQQRPILLIGPPGIGKTAIMEQIAEECSVGLVAYTMTHHTRQSAMGLPEICTRGIEGKMVHTTEYTMSEIIASIYDCMEQTGKKRGILFLDEINCVSETLAPVMLQLLQDKKFGNQHIPDDWLIVAAGNPPEYNKSVREFDVATLDRVRKIEVLPELSVWLSYAEKNQIHSAVTTYLMAHSDHFYSVSQEADEKRFVTARGWEDLSAVLKSYEILNFPVDEALIGQYLQEEKTAEEFNSYYRIYEKYGQDYGVEFLVGRDGDFDQIVSSAVKRQKRIVRDDNSSLIWILPYPTAELHNNTENFEAYYDEIEICGSAASSHPKGAFQIRNRQMVKRSDLVVFYVDHTGGGAYQTMRYAQKEKKNILNLAGEGYGEKE